MFKSLAGPFGEHRAIFAFPLASANGQRFGDPAKAGSLTVHLDDLEVRYELPFASVLPPMVEPKTHAPFPGPYRFNP